MFNIGGFGILWNVICLWLIVAMWLIIYVVWPITKFALYTAQAAILIPYRLARYTIQRRWRYGR